VVGLPSPPSVDSKVRSAASVHGTYGRHFGGPVPAVATGAAADRI